ncbi:MAG TPA: hypothetical protein VEH82_05600 [Acidimicrobiales bacterium]|nr:hypothetical protein [Acidimicrobiales bacterium]
MDFDVVDASEVPDDRPVREWTTTAISAEWEITGRVVAAGRPAA